MNELKTYIIHVKGEKKREVIIRKEIGKKQIDAEFILDGNKETISNEILDKYFSSYMKQIQNGTSCALKHVFAYEFFLGSAAQFALILEDDIELYKNFNHILTKSIGEIKARNLKNVLISFEESGLMYVKGSERKDNMLLYKKDTGQMAGAYLIDREAATAMLAIISSNKISIPIDHFHNHCSENKLINIYWVYPSVACQRSLNGKLKSIIDTKKSGMLRIIEFKLERVYKKILYRLR